MKVTVDFGKTLGRYTDPTAMQNSTLRYSPPKDFPYFLSRALGRAKIMRVFITLDEYWDYRQDRYYPDYDIGVKRYPDSELHYLYDWEKIVPAPSGTRFRDYLISHAENADELLLNVRRLEREVSDGVISYEQYENVFERAVEYCKSLAPNIRYIECCNEVDIRPFGNLNADEYLKIYLCAFRAVCRLNEKHLYPIPLEIGGWGVAEPFVHRGLWEEFLERLSRAGLGEKPIGFYSIHHYDKYCNQHLSELGMDEEARSLCTAEKFKLWLRRHRALIERLGLPDCPVFLNELGRTRTTGVPDDSLRNAAGILTYLIASAEPEFESFYMFPWCTFHNPALQISFTQFILDEHGRYSATPNGIALLMLHRMSGDRVWSKVYDCAAPDAKYRAQAVRGGDRLWVVCSNPSEQNEVFEIEVLQLPAGKYRIREYLCDSEKNNCVTGTGSGVPDITCAYERQSKGALTLSAKAEANAFALFEIERK